MFVLSPRQRAPVQPQQVLPLDWELADRLGVCFAMNGGAGPLDGYAGTRGILSGTAPPTLKPPTTAKGQYCTGFDFTGTAYGASYLNFGAGASTAGLATQAATFAFLFYATNTTNYALAERNDGNTVNAGWAVDAGGAANVVQLNLERGTANTKANSNGGVVVGEWNTAVVTHLGDLTIANMRFYINGVTRGPNTVATGSGTQGSDAANSLYIGRSVYANLSMNGNIAVAVLARRAWSLAEAQAFHRNPWALWRWPQFSPQGFGGASAPWRFFLAGS